MLMCGKYLSFNIVFLDNCIIYWIFVDFLLQMNVKYFKLDNFMQKELMHKSSPKGRFLIGNFRAVIESSHGAESGQAWQWC